MGLRSQFESLVELQNRFAEKADFYLVYGREAFPQESRWPAPVPDGQPVADATTVQQRCAVAERFQKNVSDEIKILIDDLGDQAMSLYDAYPFRAYVIDRKGKIAVTSIKGAAGFEKTMANIERWLEVLEN